MLFFPFNELIFKIWLFFCIYYLQSLSWTLVDAKTTHAMGQILSEADCNVIVTIAAEIILIQRQ